MGWLDEDRRSATPATNVQRCPAATTLRRRPLRVRERLRVEVDGLGAAGKGQQYESESVSSGAGAMTGSLGPASRSNAPASWGRPGAADVRR